MDTKQAGSIGGKRAWAKLSKEERSRIMTERNRKAWEKKRRPLLKSGIDIN